jgi:hypothetical protein
VALRTAVKGRHLFIHWSSSYGKKG